MALACTTRELVCGAMHCVGPVMRASCAQPATLPTARAMSADLMRLFTKQLAVGSGVPSVGLPQTLRCRHPARGGLPKVRVPTFMVNIQGHRMGLPAARQYCPGDVAGLVRGQDDRGRIDHGAAAPRVAGSAFDRNRHDPGTDRDPRRVPPHGCRRAWMTALVMAQFRLGSPAVGVGIGSRFGIRTAIKMMPHVHHSLHLRQSRR